MRGFLTIYKKEVQHYVYAMLSYLFIVVFLVALGWLFWQNIFLVGQTSLRQWFALLPWFYLFLLPALTMRLWSEEKKQGTIEILLTLPVTDGQVAGAKLAAGASFLLLVLLCSLPLPITLARMGNLDWGPVIGSYLGAWLLGCVYVAVGQCISAITKNQIVAFLITIVVMFILLAIGLPQFTSGTGLIGQILYQLSTLTHFTNLAKGVIDIRDVVYYLSLSGLGWYITVYLLNRRHYE